jgi:hypothetical protein
MAPGTKIAASITIGLLAIAGFAVALSYGIFASKQRQEAAEAALVQDQQEIARINHEIAHQEVAHQEVAHQEVAHDNEVAAAKAAEYEKIPEIQLLRALEAEDRRELAKPPRCPMLPPSSTH